MSCANNDTNDNIVINKEPKYKYIDNFITLEKLFSINTYDYDLVNNSWIDIDQNSNLYILDPFISKINIFDNKGSYLDTIGRIGQGPNELVKPFSFSIKNEKLYIHELNKGIKIWDLNGNYIDFILLNVFGNIGIFKFYDECFIGQQAFFDMSIPNIIKWEISRFDYNANKINNICTINIDQTKNPKFTLFHYLAINKDKHIFLAERGNEYSISKYDFEGNLLLTIKRKYDRKKYSKSLKEYFKSKKRNVSKYPPIIRYMFVDDKNLLWVIVGEWYHDNNGEFQITSTIDIFNKDGEFLYTFESPYFGINSFIKFGRLYSRPISEENPSYSAYNVIYNYPDIR